jgi:hypothetical protein
MNTPAARFRAPSLLEDGRIILRLSLVVLAPWRSTAVALAQLAQGRDIRTGADSAIASRALGVMQTTWCGLVSFVTACQTQQSGQPAEKNSTSESASCFTALFKAVRDRP